MINSYLFTKDDLSDYDANVREAEMMEFKAEVSLSEESVPELAEAGIELAIQAGIEPEVYARALWMLFKHD